MFLASFGILKVRVRVRVRVNNTNTIDGYWGSFKNAMRGMKSLRREHQPLFLAEFMWRHNATVTNPSRCLFEQILALLGLYSEDKTLMDALNSLSC